MEDDINIEAIRRTPAYGAASVLLERIPSARGRTVRFGVDSVAMLLHASLEAMAKRGATDRPTLTAAAETDAKDFADAVLVALADLGYVLQDKSMECNRNLRHTAANVRESKLWQLLRTWH